MVRLHGAAFENVGINGALRKEFDAVLLARLFFKHADKFRADDLALFLRLGDAGEFIEKTIDRVHIDEICVHLVAEHFHDLFGFAFAQQAVVDVHAHEVFADRLDEQCRHDGRIYPAREREQHFFIADLFFDGLHLFADELFGEFRIDDASHVFGPFVVLHKILPPLITFISFCLPSQRADQFYRIRANCIFPGGGTRCRALRSACIRAEYSSGNRQNTRPLLRPPPR